MKMAMQSSPSFSLSSPSHSSRSLEQIAARVIDELFLNEEDSKEENCIFEEEDQFVIEAKKEDEDEDEDEKEFEFPLIDKNWIYFPSPTDEIFYNGGILPVYPVFNTNLLLDAEVIVDEEPPPVPDPEPDKVIRMPLKMLFKEDAEISSSTSSSEVDELDGISPGTYCVWNPNKVTAETAATEKVVVGEKRWRKSSSSTGVSRRWKLKDLVHRSSSDGSKGRFVFLTPSNSQGKRMEEMSKF